MPMQSFLSKISSCFSNRSGDSGPWQAVNSIRYKTKDRTEFGGKAQTASERIGSAVEREGARTLGETGWHQGDREGAQEYGFV